MAMAKMVSAAQLECVEDYDAFSGWLEGFVAKNGGVIPTKSWFDQVQETHKMIRHTLGGVRKDITVCAKDCAIEIDNRIMERGAKILWELAALKNFNVLKSLAGKRSLTCDCTEQERETLSYGVYRDGKTPDRELTLKFMSMFLQPKIQTAPHRFVSTTGFLSEMAYHAKPYGPQKDTARLLSELGKLHGEAKKKNESAVVRVSTSAKAFMLLGHCGPDRGSCFRQCGCGELDKVALGLSDNTFVVVVYKNDKPVTRAWGQIQYTRDGGQRPLVVHICNVYNRNIPCGVAEAVLRQTAALLAGGSKVPTEVGLLKDHVDDYMVYLNGDFRISAGPRGELDDDLYLDTHTTHLHEDDGFHLGTKCPSCGEIFPDSHNFNHENEEDEDSRMVCRECSGG